MLTALASSPLDYAGIHFNVQVEPGRASDPRFVLHVPAEGLEWSSQEGKMLGLLQVWFIQKRAFGEDLTTKTANANLQLTPDAYQVAESQGVTLASDLRPDAAASKVRVTMRDVNSGRLGTVDVPIDALRLQPR